MGTKISFPRRCFRLEDTNYTVLQVSGLLFVALKQVLSGHPYRGGFLALHPWHVNTLSSIQDLSCHSPYTISNAVDKILWAAFDFIVHLRRWPRQPVASSASV